VDPPQPAASSTRIPTATREQIAIERGWLSTDQVEECLALHQTLLDMGLASSLADVLLRKGYLDQARLDELEVAVGARPALSIPGYEIIEKLAEGGMGAVYRAHQTSMDRNVAIKLLLPKFTADAASRERLIREARAVAKLSHPNVVAGIDAGESGGVCFFIMEFIDGKPMDQVLRERQRLPWREATMIVRQVAAALEHAEAHGIVHRDVKPANILVLANGQAKLADLGLARVAGSEESHLTQSGLIVGSPAYLSPEQASAERELDGRSDLFSLGLTFFEFITGERAYVGSNPMSVLTALLTRDVDIERIEKSAAPDAIRAIVGHLLQRDPQLRYQSATALIADLDAALAGQAPSRSNPAVGGDALVATAPTPANGLPARAAPSPRRGYQHLGLGVLAAAAIALALLQLLRPIQAPTVAAPVGEATAPAATLATAHAETPSALPISLIEATRIALTQFSGGAAYHSEREGDEYSVDVAVGTRAFNVQVDGRDGHIEVELEEHEDRSLEIGMAKVTLIDAVLAANRAQAGDAAEAEILLLPGLAVIEVKLVRADGPIWVDVDAESAAVSPARDKPRPSP
jgi:tRNA A-37 threonylcarbamoyl transferase component Bud32